MPFQLDIQFDGGMKRYRRAIDKSIQGLKDFSGIWSTIVRVFMGQTQIPSPIVELYRQKGKTINSDWGNTAKYEQQKAKIWSKVRVFQVPKLLSSQWEQIYTGHTIEALVFGNEDTVVKKNPLFLIYGVKGIVPWVQQRMKRILDIDKNISRAIDRSVVMWILKEFPKIWEKRAVE